MTAFNSSNMFSSVAASTAAASSRANNAILGTAVAVPFFVLISIIGIIDIISVIIIFAIIQIVLIISQCKYSYESKQQAAV